jgi:hypothetical protein
MAWERSRAAKYFGARGAARRPKVLNPRDLHFDVRTDPDLLDDASITTLEQVEKTYITRALRILGGQVPEAAKRLGVPRSSLYHKIKQQGINQGRPADVPTGHFHSPGKNSLRPARSEGRSGRSRPVHGQSLSLLKIVWFSLPTHSRVSIRRSGAL